MPKQQNIRC